MTTFKSVDNDMNEVVSFDINLQQLDSSDPMAFAYGLMRGQVYAKQRLATGTPGYDAKKLHGELFSKLAKEYLRGFKLGATAILLPEGTRILKGTECTMFDFDKGPTGQEAFRKAFKQEDTDVQIS